jgi:hypothetical protein
MKPDEKIVFDYLKEQYGSNIVYEPIPNKPPDFLLNNDNAIEVRRLNYNYFDKDKSYGLEILTIPIFELFEEVLQSFDPQYKGETYWVVLRYKRPINKKLSKIKDDLRIALSRFLEMEIHESPYKMKVGKNIDVEYYKGTPFRGRVFRSAGGSDHNAGGWLIPIFIDNIQKCISDKSNAINETHSNYSYWSLYLVDYIGWSLNKDDFEKVLSGIQSKGNFNEVIILNRKGDSLLARF